MDIIAALEAVVVSIKAWATVKFDSINQQLDALYQPIDIKSVSNSINNIEIGDEIKSGTISWELQYRQPVKQIVNGIEIDPSRRSCSMSEVGAVGVKYNDYATYKFTLTVTDDHGKTDTMPTSVKFTNRVYYGTVGSGVAITGDVISGLTGSNVQSSQTLTLNVTANQDEHIIYA